MPSFNLGAGLFNDLVDRPKVISQAQQLMRRFGNVMQGNDLNYDSLKEQLSKVLPLLARIAQDDQALLEQGLQSINMFPKVQEAFEDLRLLQTADPSVFGREKELKAHILQTFLRSLDAFQDSELDTVYTQLSAQTQELNERPAPKEATAEERLLREFISNLSYNSQSSVLFTQCTRAQAVVDALCSGNQRAIRKAGADYISTLTSLQVLLVLEPILTTMAGRTFGAASKGDLPRGESL